jgi:hypothetical protein
MDALGAHRRHPEPRDRGCAQHLHFERPTWQLNGGATACYAYFTLQALYQLGRRKDADAILFPMLRGFEQGGFQGTAANGMSYDWKAWDGTPHGYEGLLGDGYQALLAVLSR